MIKMLDANLLNLGFSNGSTIVQLETLTACYTKW